ncbi:MAG: chemotaxis protein CheD [Candidatus Kariarchaeaceae archaeon]|jgi:chemotaxis protein CheD
MVEYSARIGEVVSGKPPDILVALALGSCVGVIIYDPKNKAATLAHVALPEQLFSRKTQNPDTLNFPGRYADSAVPECLTMLKKHGANMKNLHAKIAGGSRMFGTKDLLGAGLNIGDRNAIAVKEILKQNGIKLVGKDVGGETSRTIKFNTKTQILTIKKAFNAQVMHL